MIISYSDRDTTIAHIRAYIIDARAKNPNYRVVDLGGSRVGWTADLADLVVDLSAQSGMQFDLCRSDQWQGLLDLVDRSGPFDLCICTHTIEDLYDPVPCLEFMPRIAREGFVSTPSVVTELSHHESSAWRGFLHHRWILSGQRSMELVSKLEFINCFKATEYQRAQEEIVFHWRGQLPYRILSVLGPDADHLIAQYDQWLVRALDRAGYRSD